MKSIQKMTALYVIFISNSGVDVLPNVCDDRISGCLCTKKTPSLLPDGGVFV